MNQDQRNELNGIPNETFTRQRAKLSRATPKLLSELGEIAWPATE